MPILTCKYRFAADEHSPHVKIIKHADKGKHVLDVGRATGHLAEKLVEAVADRDGGVNMTVSDGFNLAHVTGESQDAAYLNLTFERVRGVSLSTLIAKLGFQNFKNIMLRMDIEGYEYKVLKDIPKQSSLINVELHPRNYDVKEFCQRTVDQGFSIECFIGDIPFGFYPLINILD